MMRVSTLFIWAAALSTLLVPLFAAAPTSDVDAGVSHCVVMVVGEKPGGELVVSDPECFGSFAEAMSVASEGTMDLAAEAKGSVVFEDDVVAAAAASFTLGIHFDGYSGSGSSLTVAGGSCTGGYWNTPSYFDNVISSSYNGCSTLKHYDKAYASVYLQSTYGVGTTDNLGTANNRVESVSYHG